MTKQSTNHDFVQYDKSNDSNFLIDNTVIQDQEISALDVAVDGNLNSIELFNNTIIDSSEAQSKLCLIDSTEKSKMLFVQFLEMRMFLVADSIYFFEENLIE